MSRIKIGFDIGGVLTKYPSFFRDLILALQESQRFDVHVLSDIPDQALCVKMVHDNGFRLHESNIHSCDYSKYGQLCKAKKGEEIGLDALIDDYIGYVACGPEVRFLLMPDPHTPYNNEEWQDTTTESRL